MLIRLLEDNFLNNQDKADALSMPIKDIILKLESRINAIEKYDINSEAYTETIKLFFAAMYHLEQAYKNKAEYY